VHQRLALLRPFSEQQALARLPARLGQPVALLRSLLARVPLLELPWVGALQVLPRLRLGRPAALLR
jgi:hypothetical protein